MSLDTVQFLIVDIESFFNGKLHRRTLFSSYYLLGFREGFLLGRLSTLSDSVRRVSQFLISCRRSFLIFWVFGWGARSLSILLWFARVIRSSFFGGLSRTLSLIYNNGYFFLMRTALFTTNIISFLGADVAFILNAPLSLQGQYQLNSLRNVGIPIIGLEFNVANSNSYAFQFFCSSPSSRAFIFYIRLFSYIMLLAI